MKKYYMVCLLLCTRYCKTSRCGRGRLLRCGLELRGSWRGAGIPTPTPTVVVDFCPLLTALSSDGPARPLGYLRAETPTREPTGPYTPGPLLATGKSQSCQQHVVVIATRRRAVSVIVIAEMSFCDVSHSDYAIQRRSSTDAVRTQRGGRYKTTCDRASWC